MCVVWSGYKCGVDKAAKVHYCLYINLIQQLRPCDLAAACFGVWA